MKIQDAKITQKSPSSRHRTNLFGYIFAIKACIDNWERKNLLNSNTSSTCRTQCMANLAHKHLRSVGEFGAPQQISTGFACLLRYCIDVAQQRSTTHCMIFGHLLGSCPLTEFCQVKLTLRPSLAFSYIGSVTARHSSSGRQPNFATWYKELNYGTFAPRHFQQRAPPIFRGRPSRWA